MLIRIVISIICLVLLSGAANAGTAIFSGYFNDSGNGALVTTYTTPFPDGSYLGPALFGNDNEIANNVAIYPLSVPIAGNVSFDSFGYTAGGAEPYFTLFQGNGNSATFLDSNYFIPVIDFSLSRALTPGNYMIALGVWENMSFAENLGAGTLGDGFTGLGVPQFLGIDNPYYYELVVTTPDGPKPPIPEPATMLLIGSGLTGLAGFRKKFRK